MKKADAAREAILSAGRLVRDAFTGEERKDVELKGTNDYVTAVDRESEKLIKKILRRYFPEIPFLAEESGGRPDAREFWVIDPLDGTTNFIHGYQQVGVSIALARKGRPVLGLVFDPLREELFEGHYGEGAYCNDRKIRVSEAASLENCLIGTGFPFRAHQHLESYLAVFRDIFIACGGMRRAGAAVLDLCHTAAGRLDGFWELYLKPWDMAAGALIVQEAGGRVYDFYGGESCLSSGNIVAGPRPVCTEIIDIIGRHISPEQISDLANDLMPAPEGD